MAKVYGRLAFIALLVYAGVSLWYGRVEERLQAKSPVVKSETAIPPLQKTAEPESVQTDYQIILTRNIFKAALELGERASGEQPPAGLEELAETKMQLVLLGTVSGSKEDARAIIRNEKTTMEDIYRVGSELQGAKITRIGRGKVGLQVDGREEILNIKETEGGPGAQQGASPAVEKMQPVREAEGAKTRSVPVVVPQRRINFRNSVSEPAATLPEDSGASQPVGEQEQQGDVQLAPNGETPSPGSGKGESTDQQTQ